MNYYEDLLLNQGLYSTSEISEKTVQDWYALLRGDVRLDCYCTKCKARRVFSLTPPKGRNYTADGEKRLLVDEIIQSVDIYNLNHQPGLGDVSHQEVPWIWRDVNMQDRARVILLSFSCAMDESHKLDYLLCTGDDYVEKIGQKPSVADLTLNEIKQFSKVADKDSQREYRRAIGLNAQGIGVGAYVYLRRIFERIISTTVEEAYQAERIQQDVFEKLRMSEKIKALKDFLPDIIVENTAFYTIVSKGIHELSEETCLQYFPILKDAIILIWTEWEKKREETNAKRTLQTQLNKIASEI